MKKFSLSLFIHAQNSGAKATQKVADRVKSQEGATTVEYVMILGIMAIIVVALFLSPLGIRQKIMGLGDSVLHALGVADECQSGAGGAVACK